MCDFGHGFFNERIYKVILQNSKKLAINTQTNSDNRGFNLITKYKKANLICIDEPEIRLALSDSFSNLDYLSKKLNNLINFEILLSQGEILESMYIKITPNQIKRMFH